MSAAANGRLASIILPCCNRRARTRLCLGALSRHTRGAWELIVVDNGSTDGTGRYLERVRDVATVPVTIITNRQDLGFPRAINQGLEAARGDYLVLLDGGTVVTDGWLDQLVALAEAPVAPRPAIGMVGPMSNDVAPPQLVEDVPYRRPDELDRFAERWRDEHAGQWFGTARLSSSCLLLRRAVYRAIGGLDERFGPGLFGDDDLAVRAQLAGFALAVAHDLFVHHGGRPTLAGDGVEAERVLLEALGRFAAKWGLDALGARRIGLRARTGESRASARSP